MTARDFLTALETRPDLGLAFDPGSGPIPAGYHVTEFKATTVRAVDCGGRATSWNELVLQVVPPARPEARAMTAGKLLSIWRRVERDARVDAHATVRVETPTADGIAVSYLVERVDAAADALTVRLAPPAVACKGVDRSVGDVPVLTGGGAAEPLAARRSPAAAATGTSGGGCCG